MNEEEEIKIRKEEKQGLWVPLVLFMVSWGTIILPWGAIRLVGWLALGLIGFSLWRIIDGLFERINKKKVNENARRK